MDPAVLYVLHERELPSFLAAGSFTPESLRDEDTPGRGPFRASPSARLAAEKPAVKQCICLLQCRAHPCRPVDAATDRFRHNMEIA